MFRELIQALLGMVRDIFCARAKLIAENALLRQQIAVLKRAAPRPRLKVLTVGLWPPSPRSSQRC